MNMDKAFQALASRPRCQIPAYLSELQLTTTELAERFGMSTRGRSPRHWSVLEYADLVSSERQGSVCSIDSIETRW